MPTKHENLPGAFIRPGDSIPGGELAGTYAAPTLSTSAIQTRVESLAALAWDAAVNLSTAAGDMIIDPAGDVDFGNTQLRGIAALRAATNADLWITANKVNTEATARKVVLLTIDPAADAQVKAAEAVPTATTTTPMLAMRGNIPVPTTSSTQGLIANFLTLRWDPTNDDISVFVNDGGVIRRLSLGVVV